MGYAVSNGGASWRMIDSANALLPGETYSDMPPIPPAPTFAQKQSALVARIRQEASDMIHDTILFLSTEYQQAKSDADAFKAAAYTGTVPTSVSAWANAKIPAQTAQWAADDIIAAGVNWINAQASIRTNRLKYGEQAKAATSASVAPNDLDSISANWSSFRDATRKQLGI